MYQLVKNTFLNNDSAGTELRSLGFPPWKQFGKNWLAACIGLTSYLIYILLSMLSFMDVLWIEDYKQYKIKVHVKSGEVKGI